MVAVATLLASVASVVGCAGHAPQARAVTVRAAGPEEVRARMLYPVLTTDGGRFITLGDGAEEGATGRRIDYGGDGFYFSVSAAGARPAVVPPRFTLLTEHGPCDVSGGVVVQIERRHDEADMEEYYGRRAVLAVELPANECGDASFAHAADESLTLSFCEFEDAEFDQPRHGSVASLGLACEITHLPSEDGICPGSVPTVHIRSGGTHVFQRDAPLWTNAVGILDARGQRYVLVSEFYGFEVLTLTGDVVESATYVGAVDVAETCL